MRTCGVDTILCPICELSTRNLTYKVGSNKTYDFNVANILNWLFFNTLSVVSELEANKKYDFNFDHQYIETEK